MPVVPIDRTSPLEEVFTRLLQRRIVLVAGRLDAHAMADAAAKLMMLDATGDDPIELRLMCHDGDLDASLGLADTIDLLGVEVRACAAGAVGGPALAPYAAGSTRIAHPNATFVLRDPFLCMTGRAEDLAISVDQHQRQLEALHQRLAAACGQPLERVAQDMRTGTVLNAEQARNYGLVSHIIVLRSRADEFC